MKLLVNPQQRPVPADPKPSGGGIPKRSCHFSLEHPIEKIIILQSQALLIDGPIAFTQLN
jgi:hypothetical protein